MTLCLFYHNLGTISAQNYYYGLITTWSRAGCTNIKYHKYIDWVQSGLSIHEIGHL